MSGSEAPNLENCLPWVQEQELMERMLAWNNRYVIEEAIEIED